MGPGEFSAPAGLDVGPDGRVYVAEFYNHRVQIFDSAGSLVGVVGRRGHGADELYYPTDLALNTRGDVVVADAYNHRIHALDTDRTTVFDWGGNWTGNADIVPFKVPSGVAIDRRGRVHVADSENKRAVLVDSEGNFLAEWKLTEDAHPEVHSPTRVATGAGRAYFVDTANDRVVVLEIRP